MFLFASGLAFGCSSGQVRYGCEFNAHLHFIPSRSVRGNLSSGGDRRLDRRAMDDFAGCVNDKDEIISNNDHKEELLMQSLKSPSCLYDLNRYKKGRNPSHAQRYPFSPSDLIPLWMRAQRNTDALRQLFMLFEVQQKLMKKL